MKVEEVVNICKKEAEKNNAKFRGCTLADNYTNNFPCEGKTCLMTGDIGCAQKEEAFLKAAKILEVIELFEKIKGE